MRPEHKNRTTVVMAAQPDPRTAITQKMVPIRPRPRLAVFAIASVVEHMVMTNGERPMRSLVRWWRNQFGVTP